MMAALLRRPGTRPFVYGHRGQRGVPENTLLAFERALCAGADGVELDVRVCASGELVVMHDPDLRRMAGLPDAIAQLPYTALARIDLGQGATVPLLRDVLQLMASRSALLNVEIKHDVPDLARSVQATAQELLAASPEQQARSVVSSFDAGALAMFRQQAPGLAVAFLYASAEQEAQAPALPSAYGEHPRRTLVDAALLARVRRRASFVNVWTVNEPAEAQRLAELGVDGVISDEPATVLAALG
jgi:glycerophosphoryl diester phosphodiesterase